MNNHNYTIPAAIIIAGVLVAGAIVYTKTPKSPPNFNLTVSENSHIRGNLKAPVTIVEFSDFQCPFCQRFHPTVRQILEDYPDKVRWVYKHFPLDQIHPEAKPAAEAAECLAEQKGDQGFWQFADGLFENQSKLEKSFYLELAQNMNLDLAQFESCISSGKYQDRVETDFQEGVNLGIRGTPGSFVNGAEVFGAVSYETLKRAVEQAILKL